MGLSYKTAYKVVIFFVDKKYERDKVKIKQWIAYGSKRFTNNICKNNTTSYYCGSRAGNKPIYREKAIEAE